MSIFRRYDWQYSANSSLIEKAGNVVVADVPHQAIILKNGKLAREICMVVGVIGENGPIRVPQAPIFLEKYLWLAKLSSERNRNAF
jgi:hypothetical protein